MSFIVTLVAAQENLSIGHIAEAENILQQEGMNAAGEPHWLCEHKAADLPFTVQADHGQIEKLRKLFENDQIDVFTNPQNERRKKLLIADMDSTIVEGETLDEIAAEAGIKDKIAPITERAMRGELDFEQALRERVKLLTDLPEQKVQTTLDKTKLNPGAKTFVQTMKRHGATCVLVSGGFTLFTKTFGDLAGFDNNHGNVLHIEGGKILGTVGDPILNKDSKVEYLLHYMNDLSLKPDQTMAIGDGANDLPMLQRAGLGIGYKPKPLLKDSLANCIIHGDLVTALYAQGYKKEEIQFSD